MLIPTIRVSTSLLFAIQGAETDFVRHPRASSREAYGALQIRQICIDDVNRIYGTHFVHADVMQDESARKICSLYLTYWGSRYIKQTGCYPTDQVLARIWYGGPDGWKHRDTRSYWAQRVCPYLCRSKV